MLNSNDRKLKLSGWLQENNASAYNSALKLQKFLFFYEVFSKNATGHADFSSLKGYKRGPVFSTVFGDYTHDSAEFALASKECYSEDPSFVNPLFAKKANFMIDILSEDELSELTHQYNIWNSKSERILSGEQQVPLSESDFTAEDNTLTDTLFHMFSVDTIENSKVIHIGDNSFVYSTEDAHKITSSHMDTMFALSKKENLSNPVFVNIDEEGRLLID